VVAPPPKGISAVHAEGDVQAYPIVHAAQLLGCSESKVRGMVARGVLRGVRGVAGSTRLLVHAEDVLGLRRDLLRRLGAREEFDLAPAHASPAVSASDASITDDLTRLEARIRYLEEKIRLFAASQSAHLESLLLDLSDPELAPPATTGRSPSE
jgi:excisionase family DNA binding protein